MLNTSNATHAAAVHNNRMIVRSLECPRRRGEAIQALPNPMPRIKAISTTANDCSDEPKISANDREDSTSRPIETAPVIVTMTPAQRKSLGEVTLGSVAGSDWPDCRDF